MRVPTMYVQVEDWQLLKQVIAKAAVKFGECSWIGIGYEIDEKEEPNAFHVERIVYPAQENTQASTEFNDDSIAKILAGLEDGERIIWHGHSHGNMESFFSGDDNELYSDWTKDLEESFFLMTIHTTKSSNFSQRVCWKGMDFNTNGTVIELLGEDQSFSEANSILEACMSKPIVTSPLSLYPSGYGGSWVKKSKPQERVVPADFDEDDFVIMDGNL